MTTLLVADIHLQAEEPARTAGFLRFLRTEARQADSLYILGDLFEFWIGDDEVSELNQTICQALRVLAEQHVKCFILHGNRDFLLGPAFINAARLTLIDTERVIHIGEKKIVILHGDTLCTDDKAYQRFRQIMHFRWLQRLFLRIPLWYRVKIAGKIRKKSRQSNRQKNAHLMDVNLAAVNEKMQANAVSLMVHGHTHRCNVHHDLIEGKKTTRIVLGAWEEEGSYVSVTDDTIDLCVFPFSSPR